jgi:hypothetical protein
MTDVILEKTSATQAAVAVVIAGLSPALPGDVPAVAWPQAKYQVEAISRTLGELSETTIGTDQEGADFYSEVSAFYAKMLSSQIRLDPEIERILDENAWELYIRD